MARRIYHIFADLGIESELLATYGDVIRLGLSPQNFTGSPRSRSLRDGANRVDIVQADANTLPIDGKAEFALLQPECARWSEITSVTGDPEDHPNQIPLAREIGEELAEYYVIENKPTAPLKNPTVLNGYMFGLPLKYERAFESNFDIERPPKNETMRQECSPWNYSDRSAEWWASVKGYSSAFQKEELAKNCIPRPMLNHILREYLRQVNPRDQEEGSYYGKNRTSSASSVQW